MEIQNSQSREYPPSIRESSSSQPRANLSEHSRDRIFLSSMLSIIALHRYVYVYIYICPIRAFTSTRSSMNSYKLHRFTAGRLPIYRGIYRLIPRARAQQGDMYT